MPLHQREEALEHVVAIAIDAVGIEVTLEAGTVGARALGSTGADVELMQTALGLPGWIRPPREEECRDEVVSTRLALGELAALADPAQLGSQRALDSR
jgi:hypothetical protein